MNRIARTLVAATLLLASFAAAAHSNALGPLLSPRVMEAGVSFRSIDRTVGYLPYTGAAARNTNIQQNDLSVFGRYGVTSNATFSFELSVTPDEIAFDNTSGSLYVVGSALQLGVWANPQYSLSFGIHYASMYWSNEEKTGPDLDEQLLEVTLQLQRSWTFNGADAKVWVAPLVSYFMLKAQAPANNAFQEPDDTAGGLIGANATFYKHVGVETQYLWVETSELRVAMFYRF